MVQDVEKSDAREEEKKRKWRGGKDERREEEEGKEENRGERRVANANLCLVVSVRGESTASCQAPPDSRKKLV